MRNRANSTGIVWYLGLTFGLAWASWEVVLRSGTPLSSMQFQLFAIPGAFSPALAALVVRRWITREGFADAGLALHLHRWPYFVIALLLPLAVVAMISAEASWLNIAQPDFTFARALASDAAGPAAIAIAASGHPVVPQLLVGALLSTPLLWGEEFGWRGYLQPRLFVGRPILAAIGTGFIWGVWHFPVTLRGYDYPEHPVLGSLLLTVIAILFSYIFGFLFERTGSIWSSSLAHAATNAIGGSLTLLLFAGGGDALIVSYGGLLAIPPLSTICLLIYCTRCISPRLCDVNSRWR